MPITGKPEGIENIIADAERMKREDEAKKAADAAVKAAEAATKTGEEPVKPATEAKVEPKTEAKPAEAKAEEKKQPEPEAKPTADTAKLDKAIDALESDDEDVKQDDKGNVTLPFKAFERRIQRAGRAHLKAIFGTDDRNEILKMKKDYEDMIAARETERKAKLSEIERIKEEKAQVEKRAADLEARETARQEKADAEAEEARVNAIAAKYVDAEASDFASYKFAKHLSRKTKEELEDYDDAKIETWYKSFAVKYPKYSKAAPVVEAKAEEKKPEAVEKKTEEKKTEPKKVVRFGLSVGAAPESKPNAKVADPSAKTPRPGASNSMSDKEWADYKRKNGINY